MQPNSNSGKATKSPRAATRKSFTASLRLIPYDLIVSARKMQKPNVIANCHGTVLLTSGNKRCCAYCGNQNVHGELAAPSKGIPGGTRWRRRESGNANPVSA